MARNYAALPHEYLDEMDILSDAEFGRLCRALLQYSMEGREGQLAGTEKVLWKRVKKQEDRFQESYKEQVRAKSDAGKKGAEKRWRRAADDSNDGTAMADDSTGIAGGGKNGENETKTETEIKTETNIPPSVDGRDAPPVPSGGRRAVSLPRYEADWFGRLWALYPRKTNRVQAVKAWDKLKPDRQLCSVMAEAVRTQMQSRQWQDPQHIPHLSTWLNGERWNDETGGRPWAYDPGDVGDRSL